MVGGDFNITGQSPGDGELGRRLDDSCREAGWGFGHMYAELEVRSMPTPFPLIRIAYIFHSGDTRGSRAYVGDTGGPDRRFLVAEAPFWPGLGNPLANCLEANQWPQSGAATLCPPIRLVVYALALRPSPRSTGSLPL